ncbi:MAG: hypothetical protein GX030_01810 [Firmicutes bacterium]|nr:hypothetical protein [Bacillota bacterium]
MDIYERLQVKKMINAAGTYTVIGGSRMSQTTLQAMAEAAAYHVDLPQLQRAVGRRLAELTRNEAAYVTCGAAAALYLSIAACAAKKLQRPLARLTPDVVADCEVIVHRAHRNAYDWALRQLGVKIVDIGYPNDMSPTQPEDLLEAINDNTVALFYAWTEPGGWVPPGALTLAQTLEIAGRYNVPVIVDAAAQLPPMENLWRFTEAGAAAAVFSGGKDLRGPQASGLLVGKQWLVDLILDTGFPTHGIGRMLKVGREEMVGLLSAVEQYVSCDHIARRAWCETQVNRFIEAFADDADVEVVRSFPNEAGQPLPRAIFRLIASWAPPTAELIALLKSGTPAIYTIPADEGGIYLNPMTLREDEVGVIIHRLREIVGQLRQTQG